MKRKSAKFRKIPFVGHAYEYKEEKEEKEYRSPLEKYIKKDKKPEGLGWKMLSYAEDI